ncbi:hypothetical protein [Halolamina salina]|uniref:DUF8166 domain-containing protein n=1 Tax=Halolamina salina TaxID=1220023 RepID=A0ABD6B9V0_9EURY
MTQNTPPPEDPALTEHDLTLGTVAQSRSQMDYVVEVYRERERERPPEKQDYEFGQPVYSTTTVRGDEYAVVGVVYDSQLVDPDQGREGPRLSNPDQEMFVPGYVDEKRTLLGVAFLGFAQLSPSPNGDGHDFTAVEQAMPRWTLDIDDPISKLSPEGFRQFHFPNDALHVQYYDRLISTADRFGAEVTLSLIDRLRTDTPADENMLDVIEQKVRWEANADRGVLR